MRDIYKSLKTPDIIRGFKTRKDDDITIEKERSRIRKEFSKGRKKDQRNDIK